MTREELDTLWNRSVNQSIKAGDSYARYRYAEYVAKAALAEPEKGNCADGSCNCCWTDKPDAKREPATVEQIDEEYIGPVIDARWHDFEAGFRAAERFHGIGKEDKT
jgi:hypothetical protein